MATFAAMALTDFILLLFNIGFLPIRIWDILDILIVGYLMYQIYKLLKGNIAFNISIGVLTMYVVWWLVNQLGMDLLSAVLDQFVNVGVIIIIIIFQPEVRRFLLFLGNTTLRQRFLLLRRMFDDQPRQASEDKQRYVKAIKEALLRLAQNHTGALILLTKDFNLVGLTSSGVAIDAHISEALIVSIFNKESPLHDGAMLITKGKIHAASCVLPVSDNPDIPKQLGLRHRAAVGITEKAAVAVFVVSEETGGISFVYEGQLKEIGTEAELGLLLRQHF